MCQVQQGVIYLNLERDSIVELGKQIVRVVQYIFLLFKGHRNWVLSSYISTSEPNSYTIANFMRVAVKTPGSSSGHISMHNPGYVLVDLQFMTCIANCSHFPWKCLKTMTYYRQGMIIQT